jgi:trimeric autotransporter adhesin
MSFSPTSQPRAGAATQPATRGAPWTRWCGIATLCASLCVPSVPALATATCPFDDGNSSLGVEGLVLTRYALGLTGAPLVLSTGISAIDAPQVEATLSCPSCGLNITGNPTLTVADATIISRKLAGYSGAALTNGVNLGSGTRNTPAAVQSFLLSGCGASGGGGTVTSVGAGYGLVANGPNVLGGAIVTSGLMELANGFILPQGCATGQVPKSDGANVWNCAPDDTTGSATNAFVQGGNAFGAPAVLGTTDAQPLTVQSGGTSISVITTTGDGLRLSAVAEADYRSANVINGSTINRTAPGIVGATIAGGGQDTIAAGAKFPNEVFARYGTVSGGSGNRSNEYAVVGGGLVNTASGDFSIVAGGLQNNATTLATTVAGGRLNTANNIYAMVAGGYRNTASGESSTVAGGDNNIAHGIRSFAAGHHANADAHQCAIFGLWSTITQYGCGGYANAFFVGADKGLYVDFNTQQSNGRGTNFISLGNFTAGRVIDTGSTAHLTFSGVWTNASDRARKENLKPINAKSVLQKVLALPVTTWNYITEGDATRRMGPMAQDFYAAFRLGSDNKTIGTVDAHGVALAAIQGLNQKLVEQAKVKDAEIAQLKSRLTATTQTFDRELAAIKKRLGM